MTDAGNRNRPDTTLRKHLLRLVRQLARGECAYQPVDGDMVRLEGDGEERFYPEAVVKEAVSLGLACIAGNRMAASRMASSFLRRALAEGEGAFADQHREIVSGSADVEGTRQPVRRNLQESPLGPIARMKDRDGNAFIPVEAVDAGERLMGDFTRGQLQPRITASWEPRLSTGAKGMRGSQADLADSAIAARGRFTRAVEAMGPELSGVAIDVCCFSKGLETVERERQWPARSAKLMLRAALLALARHYAPPAPKGRRRHHWGSDDYRPSLERT